MSAEALEIDSNPGRIRGREARTQSIATRFTRTEEKALLKKAEASGQNLREWARDVLLRGNASGGRDDLEMHIFTELVGIQMLLMNALEPLLRGDKMVQDQLAILFRRVQTTKAAKAQELLAKRSQNREK
ncbi:MAG TPA: hypothetical protein VGI45_29005 [Terracidiphilus sp.]|jgi:hypothetical protein